MFFVSSDDASPRMLPTLGAGNYISSYPATPHSTSTDCDWWVSPCFSVLPIWGGLLRWEWPGVCGKASKARSSGFRPRWIPTKVRLIWCQLWAIKFQANTLVRLKLDLRPTVIGAFVLSLVTLLGKRWTVFLVHKGQEHWISTTKNSFRRIGARCLRWCQLWTNKEWNTAADVQAPVQDIFSCRMCSRDEDRDVFWIHNMDGKKTPFESRWSKNHGNTKWGVSQSLLLLELFCFFWYQQVNWTPLKVHRSTGDYDGPARSFVDTVLLRLSGWLTLQLSWHLLLVLWTKKGYTHPQARIEADGTAPSSEDHVPTIANRWFPPPWCFRVYTCWSGRKK